MGQPGGNPTAITGKLCITTRNFWNWGGDIGETPGPELQIIPCSYCGHAPTRAWLGAGSAGAPSVALHNNWSKRLSIALGDCMAGLKELVSAPGRHQGMDQIVSSNTLTYRIWKFPIDAT